MFCGIMDNLPDAALATMAAPMRVRAPALHEPSGLNGYPGSPAARLFDALRSRSATILFSPSA